MHRPIDLSPPSSSSSRPRVPRPPSSSSRARTHRHERLVKRAEHRRASVRRSRRDLRARASSPPIARTSSHRSFAQIQPHREVRSTTPSVDRASRSARARDRRRRSLEPRAIDRRHRFHRIARFDRRRARGFAGARSRPRRHRRARSRRRAMPLRLQKKASRVVRAVAEEVQVARGVGTRTDKRGNAKTALWERGKVRSSGGLARVSIGATRIARERATRGDARRARAETRRETRAGDSGRRARD